MRIIKTIITFIIAICAFLGMAAFILVLISKPNSKTKEKYVKCDLQKNDCPSGSNCQIEDVGPKDILGIGASENVCVTDQGKILQSK
jgi:hypothetical protein